MHVMPKVEQSVMFRLSLSKNSCSSSRSSQACHPNQGAKLTVPSTCHVLIADSRLLADSLEVCLLVPRVDLLGKGTRELAVGSMHNVITNEGVAAMHVSHIACIANKSLWFEVCMT
jgi:hypothetical protein